ncbi:MAG: surface-adhesin E family protein [Nitrospiraceae bacterium]
MPFTSHLFRRFLGPLWSSAVNAIRFLTLTPGYLLGFWVLITLLVLDCGPVRAAWELVSGDDSAKLTVYVDRDTIRRNGNLAQMWQMYDYKTVQTVAGDSLLSIQRYNEYDCTGARTRMLTYTWFSSNMGRGRVVYKTAEEQPWASIVPRSIDQTLLKVACSKP